MYKLFVLFLAALTIASNAQNDNTVEAKVTDVTVFMNGAQITHTTDVALKSGTNTLRFTDLPLYMDPNSVTVEGSQAYTIISVKHQVNYLTDQSRSPEIKAIQDSIEYLQYKLQELQALKNVVTWEKAVFENNRSIKGSDAVLAPEDVADMANLVRQRMKEIEYRSLDLTQQEKKTNKDLTRLNNQLNAMNARKGTNPSEVIVKLDAGKAGNAKVKLTYNANNAGWVPVYDLRAEDVNSKIEFIYKAKVYQSTGTDWQGVNLTVSTGNPSVGGQAPALYPWYLSIYDPSVARYRYEPKAKDEAVYMNATPSVAESGKMIDGSTMADFTVATTNTVSTEFKISIPFDIPSDNQQYDVELQRVNLNAQYAHFTIPKMDNDAFLRAQLTDWMQYSLLPGESNIYFKGTFVGKGFIDPVLANDTLTVSLGRDRAINIKRDQIKDYCKTTAFMGKQKTTRAYEITITNTKKQAIDIVVEDQIPLSSTSEIEVEVEEMSGGTYDSTTGKITWKLRINAGETVKKQLRFNAKYPKKKLVAGL